ncbi:hypothetical protein SALBM217S_02358 [Streptomyces griseoloalbus]
MRPRTAPARARSSPGANSALRTPPPSVPSVARTANGSASSCSPARCNAQPSASATSVDGCRSHSARSRRTAAPASPWSASNRPSTSSSSPPCVAASRARSRSSPYCTTAAGRIPSASYSSPSSSAYSGRGCRASAVRYALSASVVRPSAASALPCPARRTAVRRRIRRAPGLRRLRRVPRHVVRAVLPLRPQPPEQRGCPPSSPPKPPRVTPCAASCPAAMSLPPRTDGPHHGQGGQRRWPVFACRRPPRRQPLACVRHHRPRRRPRRPRERSARRPGPPGPSPPRTPPSRRCFSRPAGPPSSRSRPARAPR